MNFKFRKIKFEWERCCSRRKIWNFDHNYSNAAKNFIDSKYDSLLLIITHMTHNFRKFWQRKTFLIFRNQLLNDNVNSFVFVDCMRLMSHQMSHFNESYKMGFVELCLACFQPLLLISYLVTHIWVIIWVIFKSISRLACLKQNWCMKK